MTDEQFLDQCLNIIGWGNCRFTAKSLSRLYRLSGDVDKATEWSEYPDNLILELHVDDVSKLVNSARNLM